MEYKGTLKNLRIAPRKVQLVANMVKGMQAAKAIDILKLTNRAGARNVMKLIKSVEDNYKYANSTQESDLVIKDIYVTAGSILKRGRSVSRGRIHRIMKRTSIVNIILSGN